MELQIEKRVELLNFYYEKRKSNINNIKPYNNALLVLLEQLYNLINKQK